MPRDGHRSQKILCAPGRYRKLNSAHSAMTDKDLNHVRVRTDKEPIEEPTERKKKKAEAPGHARVTGARGSSGAPTAGAGRGEWEFSELAHLVIDAAAALASAPVPGPIREELHALCLVIAAEARRWPLGAGSLAGAFSQLQTPMTAAPAADAFVILTTTLASAPAGSSAAPSAAAGCPVVQPLPFISPAIASAASQGNC